MKVTQELQTQWLESGYSWALDGRVCTECQKYSDTDWGPRCACGGNMVLNEEARVFYLEGWNDLPAMLQVQMDEYLETPKGSRFSKWLSYGFEGREFFAPGYWLHKLSSYEARIKNFWWGFGMIWPLRNQNIVTAEFHTPDGLPHPKTDSPSVVYGNGSMTVKATNYQWNSKVNLNRIISSVGGHTLPRFIEVQVIGLPFMVDLKPLEHLYSLYDGVLYIDGTRG